MPNSRAQTPPLPQCSSELSQALWGGSGDGEAEADVVRHERSLGAVLHGHGRAAVGAVCVRVCVHVSTESKGIMWRIALTRGVHNQLLYLCLPFGRQRGIISQEPTHVRSERVHAVHAIFLAKHTS